MCGARSLLPSHRALLAGSSLCVQEKHGGRGSACERRCSSVASARSRMQQAAPRWLRWLGAAVLCVGAVRHWHAQGITSCAPLSAEQPLFTLGLIADVQFADVEDGYNYARTVRRAFRGALVQLGRAVDWWNALDTVAVAQLGDLTDGRNAALGQSEVAFERAMRRRRARA